MAPLRIPTNNATIKPKDASTTTTTTTMSVEYGPDDLFASIRYNRNTKLDNQKLALQLLDATEAVSPFYTFL